MCGATVRFFVTSFDAGVYMCDNVECTFPLENPRAASMSEFIVQHQHGVPQSALPSALSVQAAPECRTNTQLDFDLPKDTQPIVQPPAESTELLDLIKLLSE